MLWRQLLNSVSEILWVSDLRKKETRRQKNVRGWSKRFLYLQYFRSLEKSRRAGCPGMLDVFSGWVWWNHISGETEVKGSLAWRQWVEALSPCFVIASGCMKCNVHLPLFSRCYRVFSMALASSVPLGVYNEVVIEFEVCSKQKLSMFIVLVSGHYMARELQCCKSPVANVENC